MKTTLAVIVLASLLPISVGFADTRSDLSGLPDGVSPW